MPCFMGSCGWHCSGVCFPAGCYPPEWGPPPARSHQPTTALGVSTCTHCEGSARTLTHWGYVDCSYCRNGLVPNPAPTFTPRELESAADLLEERSQNHALPARPPGYAEHAPWARRNRYVCAHCRRSVSGHLSEPEVWLHIAHTYECPVSAARRALNSPLPRRFHPDWFADELYP